MHRIIIRWTLTTFLLGSILLTGCSSGGMEHVLPEPPPAAETEIDLPEIEAPSGDSEGGRQLFGIWEFYFDPDTRDVEVVPIRNIQPHYDITNMLLPPLCGECLEIDVYFFDPVSFVLGVNITLRNPYTIPGRDLRGILFTNEAGHKLLNPDAWTALFDIQGGEPLNPFIAFGKNKPNRVFASSQSYTETYYIQIPHPPQWGAIKYAAEGSWFGNCKEPYAIENFVQDAPLSDSVGAKATLEIEVWDWQNDVSKVTIVAPNITGENFTQFGHVSGNLWRLNLTNNLGFTGEEVTLRIIASSPNPDDIALYYYVPVTIVKSSPVVLGVEPDSGAASTDLTGVLINGQSFQGLGALVKLSKPEKPDIVATNVNVIDGATISCDISIPQTAPLGMYDVEVTNGNGNSDLGVDMFEVLCAPPTVAGIQPDNAASDTQLPSAVITGDNFVGPAAQVKLRLSGQPAVNATNVVVVDSQTITCSLTISCDKAIGFYDVEVRNDCGSTGTGTGLFEVFCPAPGVNIVSPGTGSVGESLSGVTVSGTNLICDDASVRFIRTGAPDIIGVNVSVVDSATVTCDIDIPLLAPMGIYDVEVTNDCQESTIGTGLFEVICPVPVVTGRSVPNWEAGSTLNGLEIYGSGFAGPTAVVKLRKTSAPDIEATNVVIIDQNTISCDLNLPLQAAVGFYDIMVTNGCGETGYGANLFQVTCPPPTVTSINPDSWTSYPGQPIDDAVITGTNFTTCDGVSEVYIDNGSIQIYATDIDVLSQNSLTCDFNIAGYSFAYGAYDIVVGTLATGRGVGLFTIYDNLLFKQNFADGDGGCTGTGTLGGYTYCTNWWAEYNPCNQPYPESMFLVFLTPAFDVPATALDVHFSMQHSIDTDIFEGALAGWTPDDGATFYGDICDGGNRWYFENGQNYNGADLFSPIFEGMGTYINCQNPVGWINRYWLGNFGNVGGTVWSQFHSTGSANLIGMSNARFMVVFLSDSYIEGSRGHEIAELIIWYDVP